MAEDRDALRAAILSEGADVLPDGELLTLLLSFAAKDARALAGRLLAYFGSLRGVFQADTAALLRVCGNDDSTAVLLALAEPLRRRMDAAPGSVYLRSVQAAGAYLASLLDGKQTEHFIMLCLDADKKLLSVEELGSGTADLVSVFPRDIAERAARVNCAYIILAHNHPTGLLSASSMDCASTEHIAKVLRAVGIGLLDHIIVGDGRYYSFREKNLLSPQNEANQTE